jgi:hypothetical protein
MFFLFLTRNAGLFLEIRELVPSTSGSSRVCPFCEGPELGWSIYPLEKQKFSAIARAMLEEKNWVTLIGGFRQVAESNPTPGATEKA